MKLAGARVVVTGAASGIGRAVTARLVDRGALVCAVDRDTTGLESLDGVTRFPADIATREGNDTVFAHSRNGTLWRRHAGEARRDAGATSESAIDLFVANAGLPYYGPLGPPDWDRIDTLLRTNLASVIYQLQQVSELNGARPFTFVIVASGMSTLAITGYAIYAATKAGVDRFADAFRLEAPPNARVCVVYPISTSTRFFDRAGSSHAVPPPVPKPVQHPEHVAARIIRAVERDRRRVYPSQLLRILFAADRIVPGIAKGYQWYTRRQFRNWRVSLDDTTTDEGKALDARPPSDAGAPQ